MRRRLVMCGLLLLAGCQNVAGPFQPRFGPRVDDPCVPTTEQERRARERSALPEESLDVGPRSPGARPGSSPVNR